MKKEGGARTSIKGSLATIKILCRLWFQPHQVSVCGVDLAVNTVNTHFPSTPHVQDVFIKPSAQNAHTYVYFLLHSHKDVSKSWKKWQSYPSPSRSTRSHQGNCVQPQGHLWEDIAWTCFLTGTDCCFERFSVIWAFDKKSFCSHRVSLEIAIDINVLLYLSRVCIHQMPLIQARSCRWFHKE